MHAPYEQPCMPPQEQPRTPPGATMHAPLGATMHTPLLEQPCMPTPNHAPPVATTHVPPGKGMTDRCKNITLPQTSFVGGKKLVEQPNGNYVMFCLQIAI